MYVTMLNVRPCEMVSLHLATYTYDLFKNQGFVNYHLHKRNQC